ncbi:MAG TPA: hypothetical protein DCZ95_19960 [Verrucomicrobia bacterium]|nr:MAG: hypothetical protein A2X46_17865 [Lentisphaerae bacterium GWF2_57_35]HBA86361.1 hypothetical protein [Verrucomicrobiota bacterium]
MKHSILACLSLCLGTAYAGTAPLVIDHTCTDISQIPAAWIAAVKSNVVWHYAHTSHGSQLNSGLAVLNNQDARFGFARGYCSLPSTPNALRMYDGQIDNDYISPDLYWEGSSGIALTQQVLSNNPSLNVSMWAWCGQAGYYNSTQISNYLHQMSAFETQFPNVTFVYMTGHLDGSGVNGTLNRQNNMIREYCRKNNKVLFDFADIESYDPSGNEFMSRDATDECDYSGGNWAVEWCAAHPGSPLCDYCDCAHSQPVNCNQKGRAAWWMFARLAGWPGAPSGASSQLQPGGGLELGWDNLCSGTVYQVSQTTGLTNQAWVAETIFTNRGFQQIWTNSNPTHPAAFYRLERR